MESEHSGEESGNKCEPDGKKKLRKMRETSWEKIYQGCGTRTREIDTCRLVGKPGIYNVKFFNRFLISKVDFLKTLKSLGIGNLLKHFSFTRPLRLW